MSEQSKILAQATSAPQGARALLVLEDGTSFEGRSCAAPGEVFGELCFNTSCIGYEEVISDPSSAGQIIVMTYPQIGNYGVNRSDMQADSLALQGLVVHSLCFAPSNRRSETNLPAFLREQGVVAIEGVDTRELTAHIREHGAQKAALSTIDLDPASLQEKMRKQVPIENQNLAATVSCKEPYRFCASSSSQAFDEGGVASPRYKVIAYDCGAKRSLLGGLARIGCEVTVVPWDTSAEEVLAAQPDGVFLSSGPGCPDAVEGMYTQVRKLLGEVPLFGVCLGHLMLCKAAGASIGKLGFGHRGGNYPVMNLLSQRVEVTAQNHGFGLLFPTLGPLVPAYSGWHTQHEDDLRFWSRSKHAPVVKNDAFGHIQLTHVNLNDGTAEGIAFKDVPAFSVQYHPKASPGLHDTHYLFTAFARLMDGQKGHCDIESVLNESAGWESGTQEGVE